MSVVLSRLRIPINYRASHSTIYLRLRASSGLLIAYSRSLLKCKLVPTIAPLRPDGDSEGPRP